MSISKSRSSGILETTRKTSKWFKNKDFRILSIDGGGIRGILPAAILTEIEEDVLGGGRITDYFDLIAGTSTGGIIALGLAKGLKAKDILQIYIKRGEEIFPPASSFLKAIGLNLRHISRSKRDTSTLHSIIDEIFEDFRMWQANTRLNIPTSDGNQGQMWIYKTPHHSDFKKDWNVKLSSVAKATSAAPTYFNPYKNGNHLMLDGGIWANNPTIQATIDALSTFNVDRERIKILSIGCGNQPYIVKSSQVKKGGLLHWYDIINASLDLQSQNSIGQSGLLIGRHNLMRLNPSLPEPIALDDWETSKILLPAIARNILQTQMKQIQISFLQTKAPPYLPIYTPKNPPP